MVVRGRETAIAGKGDKGLIVDGGSKDNCQVLVIGGDWRSGSVWDAGGCECMNCINGFVLYEERDLGKERIAPGEAAAAAEEEEKGGKGETKKRRRG